MLINSLPDDVFGEIIEILKKMIHQKQEKTHDMKASTARKVRLGLADEKYAIPDDIDACNSEIEEMFGGYNSVLDQKVTLIKPM